VASSFAILPPTVNDKSLAENESNAIEEPKEPVENSRPEAFDAELDESGFGIEFEHKRKALYMWLTPANETRNRSWEMNTIQLLFNTHIYTPTYSAMGSDRPPFRFNDQSLR
jgi:hypothetical protein